MAILYKFIYQSGYSQFNIRLYQNSIFNQTTNIEWYELQIVDKISFALFRNIYNNNTKYAEIISEDAVIGHDSDAKSTDNGIYYLILLAVASIFICVAIMGYINAKYMYIDDFFSMAAIVSAMCYVVDLLCDIFISIALSERIMDKNIFSWLFIASLVFIVFPIMVSIVQLSQQIDNYWIKDDQIKLWLTDNSKTLFLLSFLCGSSFTAVELMNSNLFELYLFSMDLSKEQMHRYMAKRIYSIVFLEVLLYFLLYLLRISVNRRVIQIYFYRIFLKLHYK